MRDAALLERMVVEERVGGGGSHAPRCKRDSRLHLFVVRHVVTFSRWLAHSAVMSLSADHPARVLNESWTQTVQERLDALPQGGFIVRHERRPMSRTTKMLWIAAVSLLFSDLLPMMPVDLGLIPDVHVLSMIFGGHPSQTWANHVYNGMTDTPHFFGVKLPWGDLYQP